LHFRGGSACKILKRNDIFPKDASGARSYADAGHTLDGRDWQFTPRKGLMGAMTQHSRIFISYSHRDRDRADFLWRELRARGHEVFIDREGILETEHITNRIREMIVGADIVLLVLGANWIASPACRMELGFALDHNKRILPAAFEDVGADLPADIKDINYVRFYGPGGVWAEAIERLDTATDRDIAWIRLHTRFGEAAARFIAGEGAPPRGRELRAMRRWIEHHPRGAPDPTGDHWRYFKAGMARRKWGQIGRPRRSRWR